MLGRSLTFAAYTISRELNLLTPLRARAAYLVTDSLLICASGRLKGLNPTEANFVSGRLLRRAEAGVTAGFAAY